MDECELKKVGNLEFVCYFQLAMMIIGGKWKPKVLFHLVQHENIRFGELRRKIIGISEKMLIQSLKDLEKDKIVHRKVYRQVPPKVEYSLTDLGKSLIPILSSMEQWGKSYASYFVAKKEKNTKYKLGTIIDNLDEQVKH
ncbi:winged helix-turn-helix transcriptional regulator [Candidatus Uabimicrobium amorphum]|uniref:Transcriptional regulator n=1 Tax=Uabimicrobium amorphum TaxID=2596890 RepID=A0A5S9IPP7_UABAM|nr:winged helix-turn-helix transcriptional regulator [Candidatus Uabimicrobium amorphum]BBM84405.1 transcriptional regulator [Candidatus Uabimicrobium amorphum]